MVWYGKFGLVFGQKRILVQKGFSTQKSFGAIKLWSKKDVFWKNAEFKIFQCNKIWVQTNFGQEKNLSLEEFGSK